MTPWLYITMQFGFSAHSILHDTLMLYVQSNYWMKFGDT